MIYCWITALCLYLAQILIEKTNVLLSIQVKQPYQLFTVLIPVPLDYLSSAGVTSGSVASVHADFEAIPVSLKARFYLPAGREPSVVFTREVR